jgi:X-Pro dipeptidyl-peptidase-like protein
MVGDRRLSRHVVLSFATIAACSTPMHDVAPDAEADAASVPSYTSTELQTMPYTASGRQWTIHLERIDRADGGHTYVEWIPSDTVGARPAIVLTEPYVGIDWTGEALDTRWASSMPTANGLYADVDGPGYTGVETVSYTLESPAQLATDNQLQLANGFALVMVFGRFYAGGTVRDYIADMAAGMWFVAEQAAAIDLTRVGIFGASWGGFEALFAAQQADPRARPAAVVAAFPPSDIPAWAATAAADAEPAKDFLVPYLHRIAAAGPDDTGLHAGDLCSALPASTLALHDEDDGLVPVAETQTLVATCGVTPLYWARSAPPTPGDPTHGPIVSEPAPASYVTFADTYLDLKLLAPDQPGVIEGYSPEAIAMQLHATHAAELAGKGVGFEAPRLLDLCDSRVGMVSADACTPTSCPVAAGAAVVAGLVNAEWGTSFTAATIGAQLAIGVP